MALALGACSGATGAPPRSATTVPVKPSPSTSRLDGADHGAGKSVTRAPRPASGTVALQAASRKGSAALPIGYVDAGRLGIQVNCQGKGTLTVLITAVGLSFPLQCVDGQVRSTYNEIHLKSARGDSAVEVTAPSTTTWALTVER
ncbi:hypothetical protein ACIQUQ_05640 [Streptomyces sp. NPDC101118]|uniref:hypothetical protein n=1 Tax=Streptomyces sp. NPDC101118 TaxID=3366109 RepID=UPI00382F5E9C